MEESTNFTELNYLSPTTRERALMIAKELLKAENVSPGEAIGRAILTAKNWAVKNMNRSVWRRLRTIDPEIS